MRSILLAAVASLVLAAPARAGFCTDMAHDVAMAAQHRDFGVPLFDPIVAEMMREQIASPTMPPLNRRLLEEDLRLQRRVYADPSISMEKAAGMAYQACRRLLATAQRPGPR